MKKIYCQIKKNFDSDIYQSVMWISNNDVIPMNTIFADWEDIELIKKAEISNRRMKTKIHQRNAD